MTKQDTEGFAIHSSSHVTQKDAEGIAIHSLNSRSTTQQDVEGFAIHGSSHVSECKLSFLTMVS